MLHIGGLGAQRTAEQPPTREKTRRRARESPRECARGRSPEQPAGDELSPRESPEGRSRSLGSRGRRPPRRSSARRCAARHEIDHRGGEGGRGVRAAPAQCATFLICAGQRYLVQVGGLPVVQLSSHPVERIHQEPGTRSRIVVVVQRAPQLVQRSLK